MKNILILSMLLILGSASIFVYAYNRDTSIAEYEINTITVLIIIHPNYLH